MRKGVFAAVGSEAIFRLAHHHVKQLSPVSTQNETEAWVSAGVNIFTLAVECKHSGCEA